ncbi:hypothetical protein DGG96_19620 [Legionella qingyii]|uniref:Uncharacterized protein n=2 Tax=Legionella qingyii TaxID=2184757 RepID=A0A317U0E0_9GAMM|nr:hypothetical protein [Legionella qingyii]PWY53942.1 hypothetical protein DGG96_19620 [Legionella qingyii]RUR18634.1 hypothetical protein ELY20_16385 [Legionella qingyii]RUR26865.1 hypothetical protein ELY16_06410 [Legionella qingyii]
MLRNNIGRPHKELTLPRLKRQLSIFYTGPDGRVTSDDPNSYKGEERAAYQDALVSQYPWTGYADGILKDRNKPQKHNFFSAAKTEESENEAPSLTPP